MLCFALIFYGTSTGCGLICCYKVYLHPCCWPCAYLQPEGLHTHSQAGRDVAKKQSEVAAKAQMVKELDATRFACLSPLVAVVAWLSSS